MKAKQKRTVSLLIPYKKDGGEYFVYIQKRTKDAKRAPDMFGCFGGGIERDESPEEALIREIQEELTYTSVGIEYFGEYESERTKKFVYILEVDDRFEKEIRIKEGEYGKYFSENEIINEEKIIEHDRVIFQEVFKKLRGGEV